MQNRCKKDILPLAMALFTIGAMGTMCTMGAMDASAATFIENAPGHNGPMTIRVDINSGRISAVEVLKHSETAGAGTKAIDELPARIIKANAADVDAVTGASVTSRAIIMAVTQALNKAEGRKLDPARFFPGTYKARVYGHNGYLDVEVTVSSERITDIKVLNHHETELLGGTAIRKMTKDMIAHQTLNVEAVSGATVTSNALKRGVIEALEQSGVDLAALQTPVPVKVEEIQRRED